MNNIFWSGKKYLVADTPLCQKQQKTRFRPSPGWIPPRPPLNGYLVPFTWKKCTTGRLRPYMILVEPETATWSIPGFNALPAKGCAQWVWSELLLVNRYVVGIKPADCTTPPKKHQQTCLKSTGRPKPKQSFIIKWKKFRDNSLTKALGLKPLAFIFVCIDCRLHML